MIKKWIKYIGISLGVLVICATILYGGWRIWLNPYRETVTTFEISEELDTVLTGIEAADDLEFIVTRLRERHPACINDLPEAAQKMYEQEYVKLSKEKNVTVLNLWQSAAQVLACLGDAHTTVRPYYEDMKFVPLLFSWEEEDLICIGGEYEGYFVNKIDGIRVSQLYQRFKDQFSYELDAWARHAFASRINRSDYLTFVGINTEGRIELSMKHPNDKNLINKTFVFQEDEIATPSVLEPFYSYSIDIASNVGVFTLSQCIYNEEYRAAVEDFFIALQEEEVHNVILDLRGNPGGNSMVANEFLTYLPVESYQTGSSRVRIGSFIRENQSIQAKNHQKEYVFSGSVYVLTSADTFSSAMNFATLLSDNGLCTVVGEIPGNMSSSYGDILSFQTPNAQLAFTVSYKYFTRPDESKSDLPLIPDVEVPANDAMEKALQLIRNN